MSDENRRYFLGLLDVLRRRGIEPRTAGKIRDVYSGDFQIIDSWRPGPIDSAVKILMPSRRISVDVTLKGDRNRANANFLILRDDQEVIGEIIGANLRWNDDLPTERQIILNVNADPTDESDWPRQHALLATRLVGFRIAFEPRIERLP